MLPKLIHRSASLVCRSSLRRSHQETSCRTSTTTWIERQQPQLYSRHNFVHQQHQYNFQGRWFSDSANKDDTADSSSSKRQPNAFRLFSLPLSFKIDEGVLRTKYHDFMKLMHPDMQNSTITGSDNDDDLDDQSVAAIITNAYNVLKRPHLRAMHLLKILKRAPNDTNQDDVDDDHNHGLTDPSADFLSEVMDLQELIHELDKDEELKPHFDDNTRRMLDTYERLQNAFEASDIKEFQNLTVQLKYWTRIDETLRNKMTSLD